MAKKKTNASATIDPTLTLAKLSEMYLEHMEAEGKGVGTCFSYQMELRTALVELGAETLVHEITPHLIERFNTCDRVMRLAKSGKPKAQPSVDKTRRVIRLALTWAAQTGLIASAPYATKGDATSERTTEAAEASAAPAKSAKGRKGAKRVESDASATAEPVEQVVEAPAA